MIRSERSAIGFFNGERLASKREDLVIMLKIKGLAGHVHMAVRGPDLRLCRRGKCST